MAQRCAGWLICRLQAARIGASRMDSTSPQLPHLPAPVVLVLRPSTHARPVASRAAARSHPRSESSDMMRRRPRCSARQPQSSRKPVAERSEVWAERRNRFSATHHRGRGKAIGKAHGEHCSSSEDDDRRAEGRRRRHSHLRSICYLLFCFVRRTGEMKRHSVCGRAPQHSRTTLPSCSPAIPSA